MAETPLYGFGDRQQKDQVFGPGNNSKPGQPYFIDLVNLERLFLQTIPQELNYGPEATFVAIASAGRNNPLYHWVGGEDKLEFTISWYGDQEDRRDVIAKCKWLEALTRNNGYEEKPHNVQFIFGDLFRDAKWIVTNASYKLSNYNRQFGMLPQLAFQEICLKRVSELNRTRQDILSIYT